MQPFHLAIRVTDIKKTKDFYVNTLGCTIGREAKKWVDFNMMGHQVSCHLFEELATNIDDCKNPVDGKKVPVPHFGVILTWEQWHDLAERIKDKVDFIIEPYTRFRGQAGEQGTMFFADPSGNVLEFKCFKDMNLIFEA